MGTMSIWSIVGHYYTMTCLVPIRASTPEVVGQGIIVLRLLEGLLGGAEVVGGIAMWNNACSHPGRLGLLKLLTLSM